MNRIFGITALIVIAATLQAQFVETNVRIIQTLAGPDPLANYGAWINNVGDTDGDGVGDLIVGAPGTPSAVGAAYLYSGRTSALRFTFKPAVAREQFGISVSGAGDINGDGAADILVGAPEASSRAGAVYVYSGRDGSLIQRLQGEAANDEFGFAPSPIADCNGDHVPDFLIGAPGASGNTGRVYLYSGADRTVIRKLEGRSSAERFGTGVGSLGDVTNDEKPEIIAGALDGPPNKGGHVYVFSSQTNDVLYDVPADATSVFMGWAFVSAAGDVNRDGHPDLLVGDFGNNGAGADAGRAWVFDGLDGKQLRVWNGTARSGLGETRPAGDMNNDGYDDVIVAAYNDSARTNLGGRVFIFSGRDGSELMRVTGTIPADQLGVDVAPMGDVDGDGSLDFAVSAPGADLSGPASGVVYVISGATIVKRPALNLDAPRAGETFKPGSTLGIDVRNFTLDCAASANAPGHGHLHIEVDGQTDNNPCVAASQSLTKPYAAGSHTIRVALVNNDGTPLSPPVEASVTVTFEAKETTPLFETDGILVSSRFSDNILRFDATTGAFTAVFAAGNGLDNPNGIAYGPDGKLYAGLGDVGRVMRFDGRTGAFIDTFVKEDASGGLAGARGIAFGPNGDLYVDDGPNSRVLRYNGQTGAFIGVAAEGSGLSGPVGLSFGPEGTMYVGGALSNAAYAFKDGAFVRQYTCPGANGITGVIIGADGMLYAASSTADAVYRFNAGTGACLGKFASGGGLNIPIGLAFAPDGNLLVGSYNTNSVIKYDAATGALLGTFIASGSGGLSGTHNFAFVPPPPQPSFVSRLVVPGVAHTLFFRTSFWLTNRGSESIRVRLRFVPGDGFAPIPNSTATITVAASQMIAYRDVLAEAFGTSVATGGLIAVDVEEGKETPFVTSRTFNDTPNGTFGQYIQAVPVTGGLPAQVWIHGLAGDDKSRSNAGITNLDAAALAAHISIWNAAGTRIGNAVAVTVPAGASSQINNINTVAGVSPLTNFSIRIDAPAGKSISYASKLDNTTSDPIFVTPLPARSRQWIDGVGAVPGIGGTFFRSTLSLSNENAVPARVTIAYTPSGATAPIAAKDVDLAAGESKLYSDVLAELFGFSGTLGRFLLTTNDATPVVAWDRTYNDLGVAGTLGQFIPSFGAENLAGARGAILQGLSDNPLIRTNLGVVNVGAVAADVTFTAFSSNGTRLGAKSFRAEGQQSLFAGSVLREIAGGDVSDIYLVIESSVPGAVYVWASYVDNVSTDQTFVRPLLP